ncbi:putative cyclin-D6-1 [Citrus sinensis]|nr:putative cyclin-D6-1 [Citrus sinensis]
MEFDLENPFTSFEEHQSDTLLDLFAIEYDHMPSHNFMQYLKITDFYVSLRQEAVSLVLQIQFSCNFEPFISYLAVTYLDRFISRQEIPQRKPWVPRLLAVSCISRTAKMKNTHFPISKFQDPPLTQALKDRATDIIFRAHSEIKLLEFKPSVIAASAVLLSSHELFPLQFPSFKTSILSSDYVNKEDLLKCFDTMQEMVETDGCESILDTLSSSRTQFSVVDYKCTKSESQQITNSSITTTTMMPERREIKRRKMNGFCSEANSSFLVFKIVECTERRRNWSKLQQHIVSV